MEKTEDIEQYITELKFEDGTPVIISKRKTGFLGFIICLNNMFSLFDLCVDKQYLNYLLTFKLSQDFLENFFCAVRFRCGWNNNPSAKQFQNIFRRLLVKHEMKSVSTGNCLADGVPILFQFQ